MNPTPALPALGSLSWVRDLNELFKVRLTTLVLLTTLVGFQMASPSGSPGLLLVHTLFGTALVAAAAAALNQWIERTHDARMRRTSGRPLPAGRMNPEDVVILGSTLSAAGIVWLAVFVNVPTALLAFVTLAVYLFIYTPLKRKTTLNTIVGAVPGALPPLMGWTAATGGFAPGGWTLFAILFFWQMPHFLAIAWMHRDDYRNGGFVMVGHGDDHGLRAGQYALVYALALIPVSLIPTLLGLAGAWYFAGALILGILFAFLAGRFAWTGGLREARLLFFASLFYLPILLGIMVGNRI
jgi:protoheme IX farnesyltransferase